MFKVDELYLKSIKELRSALPRLVFFLGIAYIVWVVSTMFLIPLTEGVVIRGVELSKVGSLVVLIAIITLLFFSFWETRKVANSLAGILASYLSAEEVNRIRLKKLRMSFQFLLFPIPTYISFIIFSKVIEQVSSLAKTLIPVGIGIWVVLAFLILAMVVGVEIEEVAKRFLEKSRKKKS